MPPSARFLLWPLAVQADGMLGFAMLVRPWLIGLGVIALVTVVALLMLSQVARPEREPPP